jgi:predicted aldo/keto reductase-like oxidoreductase
MEIKKADFFLLWTVYSYNDFLNMIKSGGIYDGALRAKDEGLIDHICISVHAPPLDIIKILESGKVEGLTLSYSVLNQNILRDVLIKAEELDIGIITMNTLAGGIIPQNQQFFSFLKQEKTETVNQAALKWCYAHPQITTMLTSMTSMAELNENLGAVTTPESPAACEKRIDSVHKSFSGISEFCTGCGYCAGCPEGIKTAELMHSYNALFFECGIPNYRRTNKRLLENLRIFYTLQSPFQFIPEDTANPCIQCGRCEAQCTQHIPIIKRVEELYRRFDESRFGANYDEQRIKELFGNNYKKIAFWPAGVFTAKIISYLNDHPRDFKTEYYIFDKNEKLWGTTNIGIEVQNPLLIPKIKPDVIIVSNYMYEDEIYNSIKHFENDGIKVIKFHKEMDAPWVF